MWKGEIRMNYDLLDDVYERDPCKMCGCPDVGDDPTHCCLCEVRRIEYEEWKKNK